MKMEKAIRKILIGIGLIIFINFAHAGIPVWTFTPITKTSLVVGSNDVVTVKYRITNQSKKTHTLIMNPIPGVRQVTTSGNCSNRFVLSYQQSCILNLTVNGAAIKGNLIGGPIVCQQANPNQCYQPSNSNNLRITKGDVVGGSVFGLVGTLILQNNSTDTLTLNSDGPFYFADALLPGSSYSVTILSEPTNQKCTVSNGTGTISNTDVTNVIVNCSTVYHTVGGRVLGLAATETVTLQNNGTDNLTINKDGSFTFPNKVTQGATYRVTVLTQPSTQTCTVNNGSGTIDNANITNIQVVCNTNTYTVGGTVENLNGQIVLQNNGTDNLSISSDGSFNFPTGIANGASYNVTVFAQPDAQNCNVSNASGIIQNADVANVKVKCAPHTAQLTSSLSDLALSVKGLIEYGVSGTPSSGASRIITITNKGNAQATNVAIKYPKWPNGTTSSTSCPTNLDPGAQCTITINPGKVATFSGNNPCSNGTAPIPGVIKITSDNTKPVSINVVVLNYACIYQNGYVYAFDDNQGCSETPSICTKSVGGKAATLSNQSNGIIWSSNQTGNYDGGVAIYGTAENSTPTSPIPSSGKVSGQIACAGATHGYCNTNNIYVYYQNDAVGAPINSSYYATGLCKQVIDSYSDWYLPAICELGGGASGICNSPSDDTVPTAQNMYLNLVLNQKLGLLNGIYWSSSEYSYNPEAYVWAQYASFNGSNGQFGQGKSVNSILVRCSRSLTN